MPVTSGILKKIFTPKYQVPQRFMKDHCANVLGKAYKKKGGGGELKKNGKDFAAIK